MKKNGYIIQELGYEYDDERYNRTEGGTPQLVVTDEVVAKKKMMELEISRWRGQNIGNYGYDIDEIARDSKNTAELEKALELVGIDIENLYDSEISIDATDEQIRNLIRLSNIRFYEIVEIEIDDSSEPEVEKDVVKKTKRGIFDGVDEFMSPDVSPIEVPEIVTILDIKEAVKETNEDFLSIKEEMKRLRDEARSKVKNFFIKGMDSIFDKYPEVKSVSWNQYTPYFNDGEECTFRCNVDDFSVNGFSEYSDDGEEGLVNVLEYDYDKNYKRVYKYHNGQEIYDAIDGFLSQLDEDDYRTMFGNHVEVIVRKGEITIEEYDHD